MLPGLQEGQEKMSKSDPSSSIFMEDEEVLYVPNFLQGQQFLTPILIKLWHVLDLPKFLTYEILLG